MILVAMESHIRKRSLAALYTCGGTENNQPYEKWFTWPDGKIVWKIKFFTLETTETKYTQIDYKGEMLVTNTEISEVFNDI